VAGEPGRFGKIASIDLRGRLDVTPNFTGPFVRSFLGQCRVAVAAHAAGGALVIAGALLGSTVAAATGLPRLTIEPGTVTVSGASSGGYMATQVQVAHASLVKGAGIFAAGPWYCARGSLTRALGECFDKPESAPAAAELVAEAKRAAAAGRIDDTKALADDRVWVFRGSRDDKVAKPVVDALVEFYRAFVPPANVAYVTNVAAAHGVPTLKAGAACGVTASPYLNACDYDGVGQMLGYLYGPLQPVGTPGTTVKFDQAAYDPKGSLADEGFLYVPAACTRGTPCRLHVAFHGCRQGAEFVGDAFVRGAGYDRWAETNRIVVLYPQAKKSLLMPLNPQGCWDWWGYQDADYAVRAGTQVSAIRAMVKAIAGS
jgi:poly(3-hydroxybutyrate) depolymerase